MTTTITELEKVIDTLETREDIDQAYDLLKLRLDYLNRKKIINFKVGDSVEFDAGKGRMFSGKIKKINQKTVSVRVDSGSHGAPQTWRVAPGLLVKK